MLEEILKILASDQHYLLFRRNITKNCSAVGRSLAHNAERRCAGCRWAECRGAVSMSTTKEKVSQTLPQEETEPTLSSIAGNHFGPFGEQDDEQVTTILPATVSGSL
jgi:hypothetical protein